MVFSDKSIRTWKSLTDEEKRAQELVQFVMFLTVKVFFPESSIEFVSLN